MKYIVSVALAVVLAACSSDPKPDPAEVAREKDRNTAPTGTGAIGNPCRYGKRPKGVTVAAVHRNGVAYLGDIGYVDLDRIAPRLTWGRSRRVATVVAAPAVNVFSIRSDGNCYDAERRVYYNCIKYRRADLRNIRVMVRAAEMETASHRAVRLCSARVNRYAREKTEVAVTDRNLRCRVVFARWCAPPKAPPAPAKSPASRKSGEK